jgi:ubiquinone/menaquinone biosynthesis C-methylase UbiE
LASSGEVFERDAAAETIVAMACHENTPLAGFLNWRFPASGRNHDPAVKIKSRFDEAAACWDDNPRRVQLAGAVGEAIGRAVPLQPDWRALDYGAGTGLLTLRLQPQVSSIICLDSSTGMLEQLAQKLAAAGIGNVQTRQWNLEADPYPEADFDLAVSSMTLHHIRDVPLVFRRLAALLKPGGWLAAADLDSEDGTFHGPRDDVFHAGFSRGQIMEWLVAAGFTQVRVDDAASVTKPSSTGQMRAYGVFLAAGQRPGECLCSAPR